MTARPSTSPSPPADRSPSRAPGPDAASPPLTTAIALSALSAVAAALAPVLGVTAPAEPAAFTSWPLLGLLAALPVLAALIARARGRVALAAGVLVPAALLAPGRAAIDLQFLDGASLAARPELLLPHSLNVLGAGPGLLALLVAHAATVAAGFFAAKSLARTGEAGEPRHGLFAFTLCVGVLVSVGLAAAPFRSTDPYLLPAAVLDAPPWVLVGVLLVAVAVPISAALAISSAEPGAARGKLLGLVLAVLGLIVPPIASAVASDQFFITWGPFVALAGALVLAVLAIPAGRGRGEPTSGTDDVELPGQERLQMVAGALAVLSGLASLAGGLLDTIEVPPDLPSLVNYPARMLLPAGGVLLVLGLAMTVRGLAGALRPVLAVAWAGVVLAAAVALDVVVGAVGVAGVEVASGTWALIAAVVLALGAGAAAGLAGGVERDEVDLSEPIRNDALFAPVGLAVALSAAAFVVPVLSAPDFIAPGLLSPLRISSWGVLVAMLTAVAASALSLFCRPRRAAGLLFGAAIVVGLRAAELPLTAQRVEGAAAASGMWFALGGFAVLLIAAGIALSRKEKATG
ncbi:hypothetical protein [Allokutzneria sp. NRRL B-24872]|uniref:hypothetical protein n=1 Tax=Allokutzneria sp. NRRL B-24872 TaxID=1137961 RepID=UPI0011788E31|nr:hypothetical protein [Allokutzneria sp. NRRL B-24872]